MVMRESDHSKGFERLPQLFGNGGRCVFERGAQATDVKAGERQCFLDRDRVWLHEHGLVDVPQLPVQPGRTGKIPGQVGIEIGRASCRERV